MIYENLVNRLRKAAGPAIDFPDTLYDEAADAIEELQADEKKFLRNISTLEMENENLKRTRRWIPVTERLPDKSGNYLTAFGDRIAMAVNEFMHPRDWLTEEGREAHPNGKWYWGGVTHWMQLPEPPKGEE